MLNDERPLSPHIQVYRWQVTMLLSILHRAAGMGLAAGAAMLAFFLMAAVEGEAQFNALHQFFGSFIGRAMLFGWVWSFTFHFLNGIRHLVWDTGRGIDIKSAARSAWFVLIGSVVCALLVWCAAGGFDAPPPA